MYNLFKNFCEDRKGNFAIMSAASVVAIIGLTGLTVDTARVSKANSELQAIVDAAALAAASGNEAVVNTSRIKIGQEFVSDRASAANLTLTSSPAVTDANYIVTVKAEANVESTFMDLFGKDRTLVSAESKATYADTPNSENEPGGEPEPPVELDQAVSVMFVVENTDSMKTAFSGISNPYIDAFLDRLRKDDEDYERGETDAGFDDDDYSDEERVWQADYNARIGGQTVGFARSKDDLTKRNEEIKIAAKDYFEALDVNLADDGSLKTGVIPFNNYIDNDYKVNLKPGYAETAESFSVMESNRKGEAYPQQSFKEALKQLRGDRETASNAGRQIIVYISDGNPDPTAEEVRIGRKNIHTTAMKGILEACAAAKNDGVEIYTMAVDATEPASNYMSVCASPDGSSAEYTREHKIIDKACMSAYRVELREPEGLNDDEFEKVMSDAKDARQANIDEKCKAQKTDYFIPIYQTGQVKDALLEATIPSSKQYDGDLINARAKAASEAILENFVFTDPDKKTGTYIKRDFVERYPYVVDNEFNKRGLNSHKLFLEANLIPLANDITAKAYNKWDGIARAKMLSLGIEYVEYHGKMIPQPARNEFSKLGANPSEIMKWYNKKYNTTHKVDDEFAPVRGVVRQKVRVSGKSAAAKTTTAATTDTTPTTPSSGPRLIFE